MLDNFYRSVLPDRSLHIDPSSQDSILGHAIRQCHQRPQHQCFFFHLHTLCGHVDVLNTYLYSILNTVYSWKSELSQDEVEQKIVQNVHCVFM